MTARTPIEGLRRKPLLLQRHSILPGFTLSLALSLLFISLVILAPLSALLLKAAQLGWPQYGAAISDARVLASYRVTVTAALLAALANAVIGLLLAWILVRYEFPGRRLLDALIDLPFALPTAVAGLALSALFAANGWIGQWFAPFGIRISYTYAGIVIAMLFTSLPFVVRTVQPVLAELGPEYEEAASSLGASQAQTLRRVILPPLMPALATGTALAFTRSLGEFGAVIFIAGNLPYETEVTSLMIFVRLQEYNHGAAAAIASVVLLAALVLLFAIQVLQSRFLQRLRGSH